MSNVGEVTRALAVGVGVAIVSLVTHDVMWAILFVLVMIFIKGSHE